MLENFNDVLSLFAIVAVIFFVVYISAKLMINASSENGRDDDYYKEIL